MSTPLASRTVRGYTHLPHCLVARYGDTGDDFPWCTCKTDGWPRRIAEAGEYARQAS